MLNNLLCNNLYLSKWKQDVTKFCDTCENEVENSEHLIFTCNNVKNIWYTLGISLKIDIKWKHIVVGFFHENNIKVKTLNNLISFTAMKIYKELVASCHLPYPKVLQKIREKHLFLN